jgi:hypothetical protein
MHEAAAAPKWSVISLTIGAGYKPQWSLPLRELTAENAKNQVRLAAWYCFSLVVILFK